MRTEKITTYNIVTDCTIEREYTIYTRDELIYYVQDGSIDISGYSLEVYAPCCFECSVSVLRNMHVRDEFFIDEENKAIILYMG